MEGAEQVLPVAGVDRRLAAHGAVYLGEKGGRNLNVVDSAQHDRRGEARDVADHAAPQRHQNARAVDPEIEKAIGEIAQVTEVLGFLAFRKHDRFGVQAGAFEARPNRVQIERRHRLVRDHHAAAALGHGAHVVPGFRQQSLADEDVIAARRQIDAHRLVIRGGLFAGEIQDCFLVPFGGRDIEVPKRVEDLVHGVFRGLVASIDGDVGARVDGVAFLDQLLEFRLGIDAFQERTPAAPADPLEQDVELGAKPHRNPAFGDLFAG